MANQRIVTLQKIWWPDAGVNSQNNVLARVMSNGIAADNLS